MTTIAYRDGIVAADSRTHNGNWIDPFPRTKLERVNDALHAYCGDWAGCMALRAWLKNEEGPQPEGDFTVIVFRDDEITVYSEGAKFLEIAPFKAFGSGTPVALGALHAGCSAEEAVRIACKVDPYSAEPITWMKVRDNA